MTSPWSRFLAWLDEPAPVLRLEVVRILAPLASLGFMSPRLAYADEWFGRSGFRVPDLGGSAKQPLYIPGLPHAAVLIIATVMVVSALATSLGYKTRVSALTFAATCVFVTLSDRLAAFTVSKISPAILTALAFAPAGQRLGVDAWLALRRGEAAPEPVRPLGSLRFLQVFILVFYSASGIAKARGEWLHEPYLLYTHLHDSYQTAVAYFLASRVPGWGWTALQVLVLSLETFAPIWFSFRRTRTPAWVLAAGMHVMIGLMFGPVVWFGLLMTTIVTACYMPDALLARLDALARRVEARWQQGTTPS
jgi:hypothetical protein